MQYHHQYSGPIRCVGDATGADDDWQLISGVDGPSTTPHPPHRNHNSQRLHDSQSAGPSGQAASAQGAGQAGNAQDFPELNTLNNEELVALLTDRAKYSALVNSIMGKSHVAQVCCDCASA